MSVPNRCAHHHIGEIKKKWVLVGVIVEGAKGFFCSQVARRLRVHPVWQAEQKIVALPDVESTNEARSFLVCIRYESLDHRALQDDKELGDLWACHACQVALSVYHGSNLQAALAHTELLHRRCPPPSPTWAQTSHAIDSKLS